jgi:hypothetical protein
MPDAIPAITYRYSAFISYCHNDGTFARRLQRQLETYRLPSNLLADNMLAAADGGRLKPIFRDRDELAATADLPGAVREAIEASSHMIVICSAGSAGSAWVRRELALFREIHGNSAILAAIAGTISPDIAPLVVNAMFPENAGPQPLAAHFSRHGDGPRLALLKLVAALAGVRLDELVQRDAQRRIHHVTRLCFAALAGMAIMAGLAIFAFKAGAAAQRNSERCEKFIGFLLTNMRNELKTAGRLDLLDKVNTGVNDYFAAQDLSHLNDSELLQRAQLLQAAGDDDSARGKFDQARLQFEEAKRTTAALVTSRPNDQARIFAHSQSEYWVGYVNWRLNNFAKAEAGFKAYASLMERLVQMAPHNATWLQERGNAEVTLGMFVLRQSLDLARAETYFATALADFASAASEKPNNAEIQVGLADGHSWLSDIDMRRHNYDGALAERTQAAQILGALLKRDPLNAELRTAQIDSTLAFARINIARGATERALAELDDGYAAALEFARADPSNADIQKQLRIFQLFKARTLLTLPQAMQPSAAVIANEIGDCNSDRDNLGSQELGLFCDLIQITLTARTGNFIKASNLLDSLRQALKPQHGKLSERWGLDFDDEVAYASAAIKLGNN